MSQFTFLQREWAAVFEAASKAEAAVHADPRTACFYARRAPSEPGVAPLACMARRSMEALLCNYIGG